MAFFYKANASGKLFGSILSGNLLNLETKKFKVYIKDSKIQCGVLMPCNLQFNKAFDFVTVFCEPNSPSAPVLMDGKTTIHFYYYPDTFALT